MKRLLNKVAITIFTWATRAKGYSFRQVNSVKEYEDANNIFDEEGYELPEMFMKEMDMYKKDTIKFIAYYKNEPIGTVGLANPRIVNRPYELHGVDEEGTHFEIQSLVVRKEYRDGSQLVMLGLFKEMYRFSVKNQISSWISFGMRNLYLTIRRYNKEIRLVDICEENNKQPLTMYLYDNKIFDTCFTLEVASFAPWNIFKMFVKQRAKKWNSSLF